MDGQELFIQALQRTKFTPQVVGSRVALENRFNAFVAEIAPIVGDNAAGEECYRKLAAALLFAKESVK